jgi:hypothetical protein
MNQNQYCSWEAVEELPSDHLLNLAFHDIPVVNKMGHIKEYYYKIK